MKHNKDLSSLNEIQHHVTQEAGTEPPFSGKLLYNQLDGIYHCICCHSPLFVSDNKFDAGCGWPSFYQPINDKAIVYIDDHSHHMHRIEIRCATCNAHLGHVFPDGPKPTGQRYCVNSAAMNFIDRQSGKNILG